MIRCCPPRPMRWNAAIGAIARCNATSIACARKCRSVHALRWTCGGKPKPKAVNKPSPHSIMHGLDKPGVFTTVSKKTVFFSTQEKRKEKTMEKTVREFVAVVQEIPWIIHLRKGFYAV